MLHRPPPDDRDAKRKREAERKRQQRSLEKAGLKPLRVVTHHDRLVEALLIAGRLSEAEALDHSLVENAVADIVAEWVRGQWQKMKT
jgi:hypothetical protein